MLNDDQEYTIADKTLETNTVMYSVCVLICGVVLLIIGLFTFQFGIAIPASFLIFIPLVLITANNKYFRYFIVSNEDICVIESEARRQRISVLDISSRRDTILFKIKWADFEEIVAKEKNIEKNPKKKEKWVYILIFKGSNSKKVLVLNRFHEGKQLEIVLYLENYAKSMEKRFIEE